MAKRTPEEVRAQREAWLARKAAREAGQSAPAEEKPPAPAPSGSQPSSSEAVASSPPKKRTPEEIQAQREAVQAARAAKKAAPAAEGQPSAAPARPASKPKPAPKTAPAPVADSRITRREFLNYAWLASIALFAVETVGIGLWFAFPNFKAGQFGGEFNIGTAGDVLPEVNSEPIPYTDGKFWLVNLDTEVNGEPRKGVLAIYKVCTHLGCLYEWVPMTHRFECPCHGSKFQLTGDYIAGPARRSLDRFVIKAVAPDGTVKETPPDGSPLVVSSDDTLIIDTGKRILGDPVA